MKKILLVLLLLPLLAMPQTRNRQCKKCKEPCSNCMAPPKDSCKPMNITVNCQHQNSRDTVLLQQDINMGNNGNGQGKSWMEWLIPALLVLGATLLGFYSANKRILSENKLKAALEWIKDFRGSASGLMMGVAEAGAEAEKYKNALYNLYSTKGQFDQAVDKEEKLKDLKVDLSNLYNNRSVSQQNVSKVDVDEATEDWKQQKDIVRELNQKLSDAETTCNNAANDVSSKFYSLDHFCQSLSLFLDENVTNKQRNLKEALDKFINYDKNNGHVDDGIALLQNVKNGVLGVISEKWEKAENEFKFKKPRWVKKIFG